MSPRVSLRTGERITAIPRRLVLVVFAAALAAVALNWEAAGLRIGHAQSGLVAAYNFDEGAGSTAADSSGLGNNGVVASATWAAAGKYGKAVSFANRGDIVTIVDHPSLDLANAFTLEAWVRPIVVFEPAHRADQGNAGRPGVCVVFERTAANGRSCGRAAATQASCPPATAG